MQEIQTLYSEDQSECYRLLKEQLTALIENEPYPIPNLANASALLNLALNNINWVGFYLLHEDELLLGPFQGKPACIHIPVGRGVCGTAVKEARTLVVPDVHAFPSHIACDNVSRSEIVIPLHAEGRIVGVLDIDSPEPDRFNDIDKNELEALVQILEQGCNWSLL